MNRSPRSERQLYPDPQGTQGGGSGVLRVYWLEVAGERPAEADYLKYDNKPAILASLRAIDHLVSAQPPHPVPPSKMEKITKDNVQMVEIKAPPRGKRIYRLLALRGANWDFFVAFGREKKGMAIPEEWKKLAASRIKQAKAEGGEL